MCGRLCLSPSSWAKEELTLREALFCFLISLQSLVSHLNAAAGEDEEGNRRRAAVFSGGRVKVYLLAHTDRPTRCTLTLSPWFVVVPLPPALTHFIHSTACLFMQITHAKCLPASVWLCICSLHVNSMLLLLLLLRCHTAGTGECASKC